MPHPPNAPRPRRVSLSTLALVALACFEIGRMAGEPQVMADTRRSPERPTFLSGGERSEIVLKEISETLTRIDGRLEKFETQLDKPGKDALRTNVPAR